MRFKAIIALTSLIVLAGCANQWDQNSQMQAQMEQQQREKEAYRYVDQATEQAITKGEITHLQGAERMAAYVRDNMPNDYDVQDYWNYVILLIKQGERGELSKEEMEYRLQRKILEINRAKQARTDQYNQMQQQAVQDNARAANFMMMQQVNRITDRAVAPPSSLNCISSAMGAGMARTNCY
ncbi:hypothetical protein [Bordetella avium]|uniref:hypothetical protein n=1 Tax=Bordetella avium TaxID=521 RepID=UPI00057A328C|nr:hypothetical protein [Bordetella avium]